MHNKLLSVGVYIVVIVRCRLRICRLRVTDGGRGCCESTGRQGHPSADGESGYLVAP